MRLFTTFLHEKFQMKWPVLQNWQHRFGQRCPGRRRPGQASLDRAAQAKLLKKLLIKRKDMIVE